MKTKLININKLFLTIWIILWLVLGILLVLKYCFNIWYPVIINNVKLITISNFIDNNIFIKLSLASIFYSFSVIILFMTSTLNKNINKLLCIILIITSIISTIFKNINQFLGYIVNIITLIIFPIIYNIRYKRFYKIYLNILFPIIINLLLFLWQLNILLIRNINNMLTTTSTIIALAMQIDYYIFLIITWMGVCYMGIWGPWLWTKKLTELEAMKEEELKKESPNEKLLDDLNRIISLKKDIKKN